MRRERYVHNGQIVRDPSFIRTPFWKFIVWKRVAFIFLPVFILWLTNPANQHVLERTTFLFSSPPPKASSKWLTPRVTNYGIFSLEEKLDGVVVYGLHLSWLCSFNDPKIGPLCETIGMHCPL
jgi:hypothetical protein